MSDNALESVFDGLCIAPEPPFHPRQGFEHLRGSETHLFYVVLEGHIPRIYTHWEDAAPQVSGFSNSVHKKHRSWSAATTACDATRRPCATTPVDFPIPVAPIAPRSPPPCDASTRKSRHDERIKRPRRQGYSVSTSAPSTQTGSREPPVLYVYSGGDDTAIYADQQRAFSAANCGLAGGSFRKVETTTHLSHAFDLATESALEVFNISDFSDSE
ncbi:hypothetical protein K438DRAFT_1969112 [Mycena galopus ATCC 62051]|nr:hypothetical protein K438DRAFT_1969112 [Mycena galopus ATCC 62051]